MSRCHADSGSPPSAAVRWHKFDKATYDVGRTDVAVDSEYRIGLYDAPRSIIDAFRLRHTIGPDVPNEALRRWLRSGGQPAELLRYTNRSHTRDRRSSTPCKSCYRPGSSAHSPGGIIEQRPTRSTVGGRAYLDLMGREMACCGCGLVPVR